MKDNILSLPVDEFGYILASLPETKSTLIINQNFQINFSQQKPNWFWRLWQYLLLGWRWK